MGRTGGILLVLGALSLAGAAWTGFEPARLMLSGQAAEGRVAGVVREAIGPFARRRPVVAYRAGGAERRILGSGLVAHAPGAAVPLRLDRATGAAMLPGLFEAWATPAALGLLGLALGLPGAWIWLRLPREPRIRLSASGVRSRQARGETVNTIRRRITRSNR